MARSLFICYHPMQQRRTYDGVRVCRECLGVTSGRVFHPVMRWIDNGALVARDGTVMAQSWQYVRTRG